MAVHLCGHHPDAGANPRIRSNPYTTSLDATQSVRRRHLVESRAWHAEVVLIAGEVLIREWHAIGCPQFQELIKH
ncbi:hypothetical protein [Streptomyces sp. NPDC021356]|uniref:hypothetical protein n=1 Tax=Streptomyces sp. NPDC021356 TaxID=3154900 RepID=UPI0033FFF8F9